MEQDAQSRGRWWRSRRVPVIATVLCLVALAVVGNTWLRQRRADSQEAACRNNLRRIQGAWCQWALSKWPNGPKVERAPTWQDLDSWLVGGYRAFKCPAGGRYLLTDDPSSHHDEHVTCTVHGALLKTYASPGRR